MNEPLSIHQLADAVNAWCQEHGVSPASGQAGEEVSERNIRYYRTIGLIDPPERGAGAGFSEKHRLQLIAVRLLQARGLPLRKIRELLFGRSLAELRQIQSRGLAEIQREPALTFHANPVGDELWRATPLDGDLLLISRSGRSLTASQRAAILSILEPLPTPTRSTPSNKKGTHP